MPRRPGSRGAHSGRKRQPSRRSDGTWTANWARPPEQRAEGPPDHDLLEGQPQAPEQPRPEDRHEVEERRREGRHAEPLLGVEHPHRHGSEGDEQQERHHDAGQEDREARLPGLVVEPRSERRDERPREDDRRHDQPSEKDGQQGENAVGEGERRLPTLLLLDPRVGGHERGGERPLREKVPQEVRNPEADPEGVRVVACPYEGGEDHLADEAEHPRDEGHGRHEPGRPGDPGLLRPRLDLRARAH